MPDLSIIIPARNEEFLSRTIEDILAHARGDTEIIVICDGNWPDPPIQDHPRVTLIHHAESIGQRAATNEGAGLSKAEFIMKCDAHCAFAKGFDVELMKNCEPDWTVIPRMYNLHAFDWVCQCGDRTYQGPKIDKCEECGGTDIKRDIVWKRRRGTKVDFAYFNNELKFTYWRDYKHRPEAKGDIVDVMSSVGACWMMQRKRFVEIGGMDESHGSWGQMGVELACKSWLSGGRQVVNKKTWFAHLFRTRKGFGFPYPNPGVSKARKRSRDLWFNSKWPLAKHDLQWLVDKFAPVPTWDEAEQVSGDVTGPSISSNTSNLRKGVVYYTDNRCEERIASACRANLKNICNGIGIVSVSHWPIPDFGRNIVMSGLPRDSVSLFTQILEGLRAIDADIVYLVEHDVLYHPSHFDYIPPSDDRFYYDRNRWQVCSETGRALFRLTKCTSLLVSYKAPLLEHFTNLVAIIQKQGYSRRRMGFAPGTHRIDGMQIFTTGHYMAEQPSIDIRHNNNFTPNRWKKKEFHSHSVTKGWKEADEVPGWGKTKDRFDEFLREHTGGLFDADTG